MNELSKKLSLITALAGLAAAAPSYAVINPKLQPSHLADRYVNVVACSVTAIDASSSEIMFGTFNGEPESLWEMMRDAARNRLFIQNDKGEFVGGENKALVCDDASYRTMVFARVT